MYNVYIPFILFIHFKNEVNARCTRDSKKLCTLIQKEAWVGLY